jgi:hypothetical protein
MRGLTSLLMLKDGMQTDGHRDPWPEHNKVARLSRQFVTDGRDAPALSRPGRASATGIIVRTSSAESGRMLPNGNMAASPSESVPAT